MCFAKLPPRKKNLATFRVPNVCISHKQAVVWNQKSNPWPIAPAKSRHCGSNRVRISLPGLVGDWQELGWKHPERAHGPAALPGGR